MTRTIWATPCWNGVDKAPATMHSSDQHACTHGDGAMWMNPARYT